MSLRIGVFAPNRGAAASDSALKAFTLRAEALGYDTVWLADHIAFPRAADATKYPYGLFPVESEISHPIYEPIGALAYLAGMTRTIRLGVGVLVAPYRNPVVLGKMLATIDSLAGGRLVLGVGAGWMAEEFTALNLPANFYAERGSVTDEVVEVMRALWADGPSTFHGRHFQFDEVISLPKPARPDGIPIWVGGNTGRAFRRLAKYGSGWMALALTAAEFRARAVELDHILLETGRQPKEVTRAFTAFVIQNPAGATAPVSSTGFVLTGDPGALAAQISAYVEAGAQEMAVFLPGETESDLLRQLEEFREVVALLG